MIETQTNSILKLNKMEQKLNEIREAIANGAKFNGTIYNKFNGKNWVTFSVYLDNVYTKIAEVPKADLTETKKEIELALCVNANTQTNRWLVNEKVVYNNLNYGQMFEKYGTDFE